MSSPTNSSRGKKKGEKSKSDRSGGEGTSCIKAEAQLRAGRSEATVQRPREHEPDCQLDDCSGDGACERRADSSRGWKVGDRVSYHTSNGYLRVGVIAQITETGAYVDEGHPLKSWIEFKYLEPCLQCLTSLPELEGQQSPEIVLASKQPNSLKSTKAQSLSSSIASPTSQSTTTSELIAHHQESMTSIGCHFPARGQVTPDCEPDLSTQNQPCGLKHCGALQTDSPASSSSKILQGLSAEDYEQFLEDCEWSAAECAAILLSAENATISTPEVSCFEVAAIARRRVLYKTPYQSQTGKHNEESGDCGSLLGDNNKSPSKDTVHSNISPSNNSPRKNTVHSNISPSNNSPSTNRRRKGEGNGSIHWRTRTCNGKDYPQAYYHWKENGNKRSKYIPKQLLGDIQKAEAAKRPVIEILRLLGIMPRPSKNELLGDIEISPSTGEEQLELSPSNKSPSKMRRHKGEGSGSIYWKTISRNGKDYPQAWYHYEFWSEGDRLVKKSKYIPKRLEQRIQKLELDKAPVREILNILGVKL